MLGRAFAGVGVALICGLAIGFIIDFLHLFGVNIHERGSVLLLIPMGLVSWVASKGRTGETNFIVEIVIVFVFLGSVIIVAHIANWFLWLCWIGAYAAVYAKPFISGWHFVSVVRPLEAHAETQAALGAKLDMDAEIAEATLRYERARAALEDAEREANEAQQRAAPHRT